MMTKKTTYKELAKKLGVSGTTVSLVLNNKADKYGIKKETQEKVLFLARKMGFFDDEVLTKPLPVEEKPGVIGMIVPALNNAFIMGITPFLQQAFLEIGFGFSIICKDIDDARYERMIEAFKKFYSGLILVSDAADDISIRALKNTGYPFIVLEKTLKSPRINTVDTDRGYGIKLLKKHIESLGYKNILIVSMIGGDNRELSYMVSTLMESGTINRPAVVELEKLSADNEKEINKIETYLRPPYSVELIITMGAEAVYPIFSLLGGMKVRIPNDVALISMNDGVGFDIISPSVTALRQPYRAMATEATDILWTEIKNSGKSKYKRQVTLSPELVVRSSCGSFK